MAEIFHGQARRRWSEADKRRLPFPDYVQRLTSRADNSVAATGRAVAAVGTQTADLDAQVKALERASRIVKPFILLRDYDPDLLRASWERFETTLTLEPAFAALGALLGWAVNALLWLVGPVHRRAQS